MRGATDQPKDQKAAHPKPDRGRRCDAGNGRAANRTLRGAHTGRDKIKKTSPKGTAAVHGRIERRSPAASEVQDSGGEETSLGNVSRGEPRCTFVNEIIGLPLAMSVFPKVYDFPGNAVLWFVEPGLYKKGWRKEDWIA